jgi:hypothetical protein
VACSLAKAGAFVCGGGVRDLYIGSNPSDLDVFVPAEELNMWFRCFNESGFDQIRRNFFRGNVTLDIVSTREKSVIDIINAFDCDVCKWYMVDKPTPLNDDVQSATDRRIATFDLSMDLFGTSRRRANKLRNNGWKIKWIQNE